MVTGSTNIAEYKNINSRKKMLKKITEKTSKKKAKYKCDYFKCYKEKQVRGITEKDQLIIRMRK